MLRVNGGPAGSGKRIIKPPQTGEWEHTCDATVDVAEGATVTFTNVRVTLSRAYKRCPACGARRPDAREE